MKRTQKVNLLLFFCFTLCTSITAFSQSMLQKDPDKNIEIAAKNEVDRWENELSLRPKQAMLMEKKLVEFALKRQEILRLDLPKEEELERLLDLKLLEMADLGDILTKPQFEHYVYIIQQESIE